jgi:hypothetical protein
VRETHFSLWFEFADPDQKIGAETGDQTEREESKRKIMTLTLFLSFLFGKRERFFSFPFFLTFLPLESRNFFASYPLWEVVQARKQGN